VGNTIPAIGYKPACPRNTLSTSVGSDGRNAARDKLAIKAARLGKAFKHLISASQIPQNERAARSELIRLMITD
jgi:hypothetical protein